MEDRVDSWNDDRLDELSGRVDEGFKEMREGFARVDREMKQGFTRVDQRFEQVASREEMGEVRVELRHLNERFDRLMHGLMVAGVSFGLTAFATIAGLVVSQI